MSGSSLDGVDLAYCEFIKKKDKWRYSLLNSRTIPFDENWIAILKSASELPDQKLKKVHTGFGSYLAGISIEFTRKYGLNPNLIASHGHTVFHVPEKGITFQLGEGQTLANESGVTVISDFRSKDISLGGQGAPLVPIGDKFLFSDFDYCLNIGGIANISYQKAEKRLAFDICPANQLINHLAKQKGLDFDDQGSIARLGQINQKLLEALNSDVFYQKSPPKSISNHYVKEHFIRLIDVFQESVENKLRTVVEHVAIQIAECVQHLETGSLLVTGGGTHNAFLVNRITKLSKHNIVIPDESIIDFKEALIFAFMGVLRWRNEVNCLSSVTGAVKDCSGGVIYHPLKNPV